MKFQREILGCFQELGRRLVTTPTMLCLDNPAEDLEGNRVDPTDLSAVKWSMWDLLFLISRQRKTPVPIGRFMDHMYTCISNMFDCDIIEWQYTVTSKAQILDRVSIIISLLEVSVDEGLG